MAERLPNWYSSKQGLTEENPTVFGSAGLGLTHAGERIIAGDDCVADITFAACALEPIELDADLYAAADAFLEEDPHAAATFDAASAAFDQYAELLRQRTTPTRTRVPAPRCSSSVRAEGRGGTHQMTTPILAATRPSCRTSPAVATPDSKKSASSSTDCTATRAIARRITQRPARVVLAAVHVRELPAAPQEG